MAALRAFRVSLAILSSLILAATAAASPQSGIVGWGAHRFDPHWNDEVFVGIAAGACETAAFRPNGTAVAWGESYYTQCYPPDLPPGLTYTDLSFGGDSWNNTIARGHVLGLRSDGSLLAWGNNEWGQCNVPNLPGLTFTSASAGKAFSVASRSNGFLVAWGSNQSGECNVPPPPLGQSFVRVAAGIWHGLALLSNGNLVAWGTNWLGCCNVPALPSGLTYLDMSAGSSLSVALRSDGQVIAWGNNGSGQCNVPALPPGLTYTQVRAGSAHVLAIRSDGAVIAWGDNTQHACDVPVPPPGTSYVQIAAGFMHSAALRSDGRVACWGNNRKFQCNSSALPAGVSYTKFSCSSLDESSIGSPMSESFVLALRSDGTVDAWGNLSPAPALPPGLGYVDVAAGWEHAIALRSDGTAVAWGFCQNGACNIPALPPGLRYTGIAASGGDHYDSCGFGYEWSLARSFLLRSDGALIAMGDGGLGQLSLPNPAPGTHYVEVAAAGSQTALRRSDGQANACGYFAAVPGLPLGVSWVDVTAAGGEYYETDCLGMVWITDSHGLGLRSDGQVSAWGNNGAGQLNVPALPPGLVYVQVANAAYFSMARRSDGSVVGWGSNWRRNCEIPVLNAGEVYVDIAAGTFGCIARYELAPACGSVSRTCWPAAANSVSTNGATLDTAGCPGISANGLVLNVSGLPSSTLGMFLYASQQQQVPFGNGWGCLAGSIQRVLPPLSGSPSGTLSFPVDLTQYPFSGSSNPILPSSGWYFQYWYRDPLGTPSTFNTSDALHVFFAL